MPKKYYKNGFTLIELLIVIGIIAILSGIVLIAVNPKRQFAQANDAERRIEIKKMLDAIAQYAVDHRGLMTGLLPAGYVRGTSLNIVEGPATGTGEIDLSPLVPTYMVPNVPHDPSISNSEHDTGYDFVLGNDQMIKISAPMVELGAPLSLEGRGS